MNPQAFLPFLAEDCSEDALITTGPNAAAWSQLIGWRDWPGGALALTGPQGSGKTHFATVWARRAAAARLSAEAKPDAVRAAFARGEGRVLVEDIDRGLDDESLFLLLDLARAQSGAVLLTARLPPVDWPARSFDLATRFGALPIAALAEPDDETLRALLIRLCGLRFVVLEDDAARYIARRIPRSFAAVHAIAEALAALRRPQTCAVTIPVAKRALESLPEEDEADHP